MAIAIDLTQIQRQVLDRVQSELADQAGKVDPGDPNQGAARFEQLMEAPNADGAGSVDASVPGSGVEGSQPVHQVADSGATTPGDRILANMTRGPPHAPGGVDAVGARPPIDMGDPMRSLEVQMEVAQIKAATGLAAAAVQKTSQGVDTLLKSQ